MDSQMMKILGIVALVLCVVCIFVAIERYNTNANNVHAMNQMRQSMPMGNMMPGMMGAEIKPAMPAATKYAAFFAVLLGIAGGVLLVIGMVLTQAGSPSAAQAFASSDAPQASGSSDAAQV